MKRKWIRYKSNPLNHVVCIEFYRTVAIGGEARVGFKIYPKSAGDKVITAKFISRELGSDVDGYRSVRVAPAPNLTFDERVIDLNENELRYWERQSGVSRMLKIHSSFLTSLTFKS